MTLSRNSGRNRKDTKSGRDSVRFDLGHLVRIKAISWHSKRTVIALHSEVGRFLTQVKSFSNLKYFQLKSCSHYILFWFRRTPFWPTCDDSGLLVTLRPTCDVEANLWGWGQLVTLRPTCHIEDRPACHVEGQLVMIQAYLSWLMSTWFHTPQVNSLNIVNARSIFDLHIPII